MTQACVRLCWLIVLCAIVHFTMGCAARTVNFVSAGSPATDNSTDVIDWSDLGLTLSRTVRGDKVDYERLLNDHRCLDRFLSHVSHIGPQTAPGLFPNRDARLAYAINCYNAVILRSLAELAADGAMPRRVPRDIESRFRFRIDGQLRSAADLRRTVEQLAGGDWRVRLALCDGRRSGPPLPRHVFLGELLDAQLSRAARVALVSPHVIRIDHGERKRLLIWKGLHDIRDRLVREYEARMRTEDSGFLSFLLDLSDRRRREILNSAVGYEVAMMPANDELNALELAPKDEGGILAVIDSIASFTFLRP